jgi:hypothetical protein
MIARPVLVFRHVARQGGTPFLADSWTSDPRAQARSSRDLKQAYGQATQRVLLRRWQHDQLQIDPEADPDAGTPAMEFARNSLVPLADTWSAIQHDRSRNAVAHVLCLL